MSALELSKEMISVEGYLADARLIIEKQIGLRVPQESYTKALLEVAQMLQIERHHKPRAEKPSTTKPSTTDQVMSSARANPQVPPMMSSATEEAPPSPPKRSHSKKVPVAEVAKPKVEKVKPKVEKVEKVKPKVERVKPKAKAPRRR